MCFLSYKVRNVFSSQVGGFWKWKYVFQLILYSSDGLLKLKVCLSIYSILEWWAIEIESMSINLFSTQVMGYWNWKYVYQFILHSSDVPLKLKVCLSIYSPLKWRVIEKWKYVYQFIHNSSDGLLKMKVCLSIYSPLKWLAVENESMYINLFDAEVAGYWKWKHVYQCILHSSGGLLKMKVCYHFILHSSDGLLKMKVCLSIYPPLKWCAVEKESNKCLFVQHQDLRLFSSDGRLNMKSRLLIYSPLKWCVIEKES